MNADPDWKIRLESILKSFSCQTGTIHRTNDDGTALVLVCQIGVPAELAAKIAEIPFGKGIAGAAAERKEPVTLCNLQHDLGGVARPDARKTGVSGSLAVPVFSVSEPGRVIGTLGVGMASPHEFSGEETCRLEGHAREIARIFENKDR